MDTLNLLRIDSVMGGLHKHKAKTRKKALLSLMEAFIIAFALVLSMKNDS